LRVGIGYDAHKLIPGKGMCLGGVFFECDYSIEAYSDGDVIIHALIDSLLGAAALGDIGKLFPAKNKENKDISSILLLNQVIDLLDSNNYKVINVDITLIAETPKISGKTDPIINSLSKSLRVEKNCISCKATTTDGLGFEGERKGITCQTISLIEKKD